MKKQILIFAMFTLAIMFAGTRTYGQTYQKVLTGAADCITPEEITSCGTLGHLKPQPGVKYEYTVTTSSPTDGVRWFVINNSDLKAETPVVNIIDPGDGILPINSPFIDDPDNSTYIMTVDDHYNTGPAPGAGATASHSIEISWKFFDGNLPNEVLLVAYVEDEDNCSDNIIVWRIVPGFNFSLDIAALDEDGNLIGTAGQTVDGPCASPIESATYATPGNEPGEGTLTVDYGENWLFYIVNAANFVDSWMPEFQISATGGTGNTATLSAGWTYLEASQTDDDDAWNELTDDAGIWTSNVPVIAGGSDANGNPVNDPGDGIASATGGECIVVRVQVDHGTTNENTTPTNVTLAVNGVMYDMEGPDFYDNRTSYEDVHHVDCAADGFDNDEVTIIITPRPEIANEDPTPLYEPKTGDENVPTP